MIYIMKFQQIMNDLPGGVGEVSGKVTSDVDIIFPLVVIAVIGLLCLIGLIPPFREFMKKNLVAALVITIIFFASSAFVDYAKILGSLLR